MRYLLLIGILMSGLVQGESSGSAVSPLPPGAAPAVPVVPPSNQSVNNSGFNRLNPSGIQVFDADFFKPTPQGPRESSSPKGRAYADDPQYNTDNRQRALDKCDYLKNQNYAKYQECYQKDLANVKKGVQEGYDEIEKRQSMPLRNTPNPLIEEQSRNPSGFDKID